MSRCAGAGREHGQADSPSWQTEIFHTRGGTLSLWMGGGIGSSHFCEFKFSLVWDFELFQEFCKIHTFQVPGLLLGDQLRIDGERNCIV